jgi:hypothetical protein
MFLASGNITSQIDHTPVPRIPQRRLDYHATESWIPPEGCRENQDSFWSNSTRENMLLLWQRSLLEYFAA